MEGTTPSCQIATLSPVKHAARMQVPESAGGWGEGELTPTVFHSGKIGDVNHKLALQEAGLIY